jgi:hypothetical protein
MSPVRIPSGISLGSTVLATVSKRIKIVAPKAAEAGKSLL